ncbi:MAG: hypothetical protein N2512_15450, partial [Armatimonadetes bacterium]|nr:hypothetical protein [Armatimonadota bacterium]
MIASSASAPERPAAGPLGWLGWRPLMIVCLGVLIGVGVADSLPPSFAFVPLFGAAVLVLAGLSLAAALMTHRRPSGTWRAVADVALVSTAVAAGAFSYSARLVRRSDDISLHAPARPESVVVRVALAWERPRGV